MNPRIQWSCNCGWNNNPALGYWYHRFFNECGASTDCKFILTMIEGLPRRALGRGFILHKIARLGWRGI
jgi:hypothetical protein